MEQYLDLGYALNQFMRPPGKGNPQDVASIGSLAAAEEGTAIARKLGRLEDARELWSAVLSNRFYQRMGDVIARANRSLHRIQRELKAS
jgi:hypothetical protein